MWWFKVLFIDTLLFGSAALAFIGPAEIRIPAAAILFAVLVLLDRLLMSIMIRRAQKKLNNPSRTTQALGRIDQSITDRYR
jgi:hypothetical protein